MRTTVIRDVKGGELPREWASRAGLGPDDKVDVVIRPTRAELVDRLRALADRASAAAKKKGLTPARLARLLKEAKAARRR